MEAGRIRVEVKSAGSCSGGSESESEISSMRTCWDMVVLLGEVEEEKRMSSSRTEIIVEFAES